MAKKTDKKDKALAGLFFGIIGLLALTGKKDGSQTWGLRKGFYTPEDLTRSKWATDHGVQEQFQRPSSSIISNANYLLDKILNPLAAKIGKSTVSSWYRTPIVNKGVGGEEDSLHQEALAVDLSYIMGGVEDNALLGRAILLMGLPFNDLIFYNSLQQPDHVHVDIKREGNAGQIFLEKDGDYMEISREFALNHLGV